jgi:prepilin-type N-terminal cleavage/methylation domain-containing protein
MNIRRRTAFTLVELLVVIAIIGVLVSIMLPGIQAAREAARRSGCSANLMQLGMAVHGYESAHGVLPSGVMNPTGPIRNQPVGNHISWLVHLLPYLEEGIAYRHIDLEAGAYHRTNRPVRSLSIGVFTCPSDQIWGTATSYAGCHHDVEAPIDADNNGAFFLNSRLRMKDISDGQKYTIFAGEKLTEPNIPDLGWLSGTRATLRNTGTPLNDTGPDAKSKLGLLVVDKPGAVGESVINPDAAAATADDSSAAPSAQGDSTQGEKQDADEKGANKPAGGAPQVPGDPLLYVGGFGGPHSGGIVIFTFGDGSVRVLSDTISLSVLKQLGHRADGKLLNLRDIQ